MINNLCRRLTNNIDIRQTLSSLRQEIKYPDNAEILHLWLDDKSLDLSLFLKNEDAKTRKNAALLMGQLSRPEFAKPLFEAYQKEDTLFVRDSYLTALQHLDASPYLDDLKERLAELSKIKLTPETKKHLEKEMHSLTDLIFSIEGGTNRQFHSRNETFHCVFLTNPLYPDITKDQMDEMDAESFRSGVRVTTDHLQPLLLIRTYNEVLFRIPNMAFCKPDPVAAAKTIADSELLDLLSKTHDGTFPFYFRIGIKNRMTLEQRSAFTKKLASEIESATGRKLVNSTSHYEIELRMIEGKSGNYHILVKFHTIKDRRFSYRKEHLAASIKPVNAALLVELAKEYMLPDAQVLDPFCGVGTMLIERQKVIKANTSYGIDIYEDAIEKAKVNTEAAHQIIHYINKDSFQFSHEYSFDEIFTDMPFAMGQKTQEEIYDIYQEFFPMAKRLLTPEGTIILYTRDRDYVLELSQKYHFNVIKEFLITKKPESYLMILR